MKYFELEELMLLHYKIIEDFGGSHGVRDEVRLESIIALPRQEAFGQALYATLHEKAAVYLRSTIASHPFVDGNKRTAVTLSVLFLMRHGIQLTALPNELEDFAVHVAVDKLDVPAIAVWLRGYSTKV